MASFDQLKAIIQLFRLDLSLAAGICVIVGEIVALGHIPQVYEAILGFGVGFFISTSVLILNDYFDLETDKINAPNRPLPSGLIQTHTVILLSTVTVIIGLIFAGLISGIAFSVAMILWIIGFSYNWKLKRTGFLGNLLVSSSVAMTFIFGGLVIGNPWNIAVWIFSAIAFLIDLGEEIAADAMDMEGDKLINSQSIAIKTGRDNALKFSAILFAMVVVISLIPLIGGWLGFSYLLMISIMDVIIIISTVKFLKTSNSDEKRKFLRIIYLGATLGLIGFILGQIFV
ncbi:UbiA family prenyltransferase [Methanobacterium alcaliphilum]|uniref:UbiA family prenyltransferase n=1 Tax=Methanobacterium alcaliphilum TaxID=392018 RepID=UPI00200B8D72|nr:UbiA family prenyltransferase [Methanobacterium alcaliphilum]MCK9150873.1 UbiA family prenyltransferase [Methanobacterium alcaliphilum]